MKKEKVEDAVSISFLLIIISLFVLVHLISRGYDIDALKTYVNSFGDYAPFVLLGIIIVTSSIGFIFVIPVAIAGLVMNFYQALFITVLGLSIGATISFFIARLLGRNYVERKWIPRVKRLQDFDNHLKKRGFLTVLFLRLVLLIPYEIINIIAGLSRVSFRSYILGTILGIIPGTLLTIFFIRTTKDIMSTQFIIAMVLLTIFSLLPLISRRVRKIIFD